MGSCDWFCLDEPPLSHIVTQQYRHQPRQPGEGRRGGGGGEREEGGGRRGRRGKERGGERGWGVEGGGEKEEGGVEG